MDTREFVDSPYLKATINVSNGDHIKILNEGKPDLDSKEPRIIFDVAVLVDGKEKYQKHFSPNKTNLKVIQSLFGFDSKNYVGKELRVNIEKARNPQTGQKVDSIVLSAPNTDSEGNVILG